MIRRKSLITDETSAVLHERNEQLLQELEVLRQEAEDLRNNRAAIQNIAPDAAALAAAAAAVAAAPAAPAAVHRVAVKLHAFWPDRPSLWFAQGDFQFILSEIPLCCLSTRCARCIESGGYNYQSSSCEPLHLFMIEAYRAPFSFRGAKSSSAHQRRGAW
ncbi:unnamed protein product [Trichogramma brassicae]|uniref:Uncharacterized protein n=1 Tax=Trichogramma brassicae TaxID=86971 RepID=A0A6H5ILI6_9HYME|nr:unnamed protein product [Trichogramma brassicae]